VLGDALPPDQTRGSILATTHKLVLAKVTEATALQTATGGWVSDRQYRARLASVAATGRGTWHYKCSAAAI